jgi:hypothetical protein
VQSYPHLARMPFIERSMLRCTNDAIDEAAVDLLNIDFQPRNYRQKAQFRALLEKEYKLRGIGFDTQDDSSTLKNNLREILLVEKSYELVNEVLAECNDEQAMIWLEQALPCLLHLENRTSKTIIEHLLHQGMNICQDCKSEQKMLMQRVEDIINEEIFGSYGCRSNWKFPVTDNLRLQHEKWNDVNCAYRSTITVRVGSDKSMMCITI